MRLSALRLIAHVQQLRLPLMAPLGRGLVSLRLRALAVARARETARAAAAGVAAGACGSNPSCSVASCAASV